MIYTYDSLIYSFEREGKLYHVSVRNTNSFVKKLKFYTLVYSNESNVINNTHIHTYPKQNPLRVEPPPSKKKYGLCTFLNSV